MIIYGNFNGEKCLTFIFLQICGVSSKSYSHRDYMNRVIYYYYFILGAPNVLRGHEVFAFQSLLNDKMTKNSVCLTRKFPKHDGQEKVFIGPGRRIGLLVFRLLRQMPEKLRAESI